MKKMLFIIPAFSLFMYCGSSKKTTVETGISNVSSVAGGDTLREIATTPSNRDWSYRPDRDTSLSGTWRLVGMKTPDGNWSKTEAWYPEDKAVSEFRYWERIPVINFTASKLIFTGNTGCNSMSGGFDYNATDIGFRKVFTSKMACKDYNEEHFLADLKKVNKYEIKGNMLEFMHDSELLMTFKRK